MKSLRILLAVMVMSLATMALAQSDAQKSFDTMKTLAGKWEGTVSADPPQKDMPNGAKMEILLRVASHGNSIVHEMQGMGAPGDPNKTDHPVTMIYEDNGQLLLTHYCDAGNRPRMTGKLSPDGKTVEFEFVDLSGSNKFGHMNHAVFTIIDANHHIEDWTYMTPGDKPVRAHMDLRREN